MTVVNFKSDDGESMTVGEMSGVSDPEIGIISEMITDPVKLDAFIPGASAKASQIAQAAGDEKPEFPVIRVEEGWSGSNNLWDAEELNSIAEQVNRLEPVAHLGHIKDEDESTAFPDPQTTWLAAVTKDEPSRLAERKGQVVRTIYVAGYNYEDAPVRKLIKRRAVRGVSWWGRSKRVPVPGKGVQIKGFQLQTLDWARKLAEGMPTTSIETIAREMKEGDKMAKDLSQVTPEEFKAENPNGYALILAEGSAEGAKLVGEMKTEVDAAKDAQTFMDKVRKLVGAADDADPYDTLVDMVSKLGEEAKALVAASVDKILKSKVPDEKKRAVVKGLLPVGEMVTKAADAKDAEAVDKIVKEMVDESFNKDESVQYIVGEMQSAGVRRREELRTGEKTEFAGMVREKRTL